MTLLIKFIILRSPEHEKLLNKLMHLADLDENGTIDKDELVHSKGASSLLKCFYDTVGRDFLTRSDIAELIPELEILETVVKELATCLSNAPSYDPFLINIKIKPVSCFC